MFRTLIAALLLLPLTPSAQASDMPPTVLAAKPLQCGPDAKPINEQGYVSIGGIEQWLTIKGASCANPIVLFIHGGPGNPLSPYADAVYGGWENEFTLVQWDQRGAGKTFLKNPATADAALSLAQMTQDGVDVASYVTEHLGQKQVILLGGSWGSILAVHMAQAKPALFRAYVGASQMVSYGDNPTASYAAVLALAAADTDKKAFDSLVALGPPPWTNPRGFGIVRRATRTYEARVTTPAPKGWWAPAPEYATPEMEANYEAGEDYSYLQFVGLNGNGLFSTVDLPALGTTFQMPVYLVQGAEDLVTTPAIARAYFDTIVAPDKQFLLLPRAGHDPNQAMVDAEHEFVKRASKTR